MNDYDQHPDRIVSPRTLRNWFRARSRQVWAGGGRVVYVNWWTDQTRWTPILLRTSEQWWERIGAPVETVVVRWYWLRFGVAMIPFVEGEEHGA